MNDAINSPIAIPAGVKPSVRTAARLPGIAALTIGLVVLYCVGFSTTSVAHNATHDTRYSNGFPCH